MEYRNGLPGVGSSSPFGDQHTGLSQGALFGFSVALVSYNVLAVIKAALRSVHGELIIANEVSDYYLAGHLGRTYDGMMIAVPEEE